MIQENEVILLGTCTRTHGRRGELQVVSANSSPMLGEVARSDGGVSTIDPDFLLFRLNHILTPFRLTEWREKGANAYIVSLDGIDTEEKAGRLCGSQVYLLRRDLTDNPDEPVLTWQDLIGYEVIDAERSPDAHAVIVPLVGKETGGAASAEEGLIGQIKKERVIGQIKSVDDSTLNTLFLLDNGVVLPAHEDFIRSIDTRSRQLHVSLPDGLLEP